MLHVAHQPLQSLHVIHQGEALEIGRERHGHLGVPRLDALDVRQESSVERAARRLPGVHDRPDRQGEEHKEGHGGQEDLARRTTHEPRLRAGRGGAAT